MSEKILNANQGEFVFPLGEKEFHFKFSLRAYEIMFEKYNFFTLAINQEGSRSVILAIYAGLMSCINKNQINPVMTLDEFYDLIEELEPSNEQKLDILYACLDSLGVMAKKGGENKDKIAVFESMGKIMREEMSKTLQP